MNNFKDDLEPIYTASGGVFAETGGFYRLCSNHGLSSSLVQCGFCGCEEKVFNWSFAASGKKCSGCGAKIGHTFTTFKTDSMNKGQLLELVNRLAPDATKKLDKLKRPELRKEVKAIFKKLYKKDRHK